MNTLEIEIAMMSYLNVRQNIIVPNTSWGLHLGGKDLHECDLLMLSKSGYATELEIKISRADLLKDAKKLHGHEHHYITNFYFVVPENLKSVALENIPDRAGLYVLARKNSGNLIVRLERKAKRSAHARKWAKDEVFNLARLGVMRILGLKRKVNALSGE